MPGVGLRAIKVNLHHGRFRVFGVFGVPRLQSLRGLGDMWALIIRIELRVILSYSNIGTMRGRFVLLVLGLEGLQIWGLGR